MNQLPEYDRSETQGENIAQQFRQFAQNLAQTPNQPTGLTWGFEIESNTMGAVHANASNDFNRDVKLDWQQDGSVSDYYNDGDCNCSCDSCNHDCNCEHCEISDYDNDHCGEPDCSGVQEVASVGALTDTHPIELDYLAKHGINEATFESDTGIHIHIGSEHLTAPQVANLMIAYRLASPVLNQIAERVNTHYASEHTTEQEDQTRQGLALDSRYLAVNTQNHFKGYGVKTVEFRQMSGQTQIFKVSGTMEGLAQTDRVRAWAHLLRLLVAYATKPAPALYWLGRAKDLNDLLALIK